MFRFNLFRIKQNVQERFLSGILHMLKIVVINLVIRSKVSVNEGCVTLVLTVNGHGFYAGSLCGGVASHHESGAGHGLHPHAPSPAALLVFRSCHSQHRTTTSICRSSSYILD